MIGRYQGRSGVEVATSSPTVRRWELGQSLRRMREHAGLKIEEVAEQLGCSPSKISRLETASRGALPRDVRDLCRLYGADHDSEARLLELTRESRQPAWWQAYDEVASRGATYLGLEEAASSITSYQTIRIPGLLQVPEYSRAYMRGVIPTLSDDAVEQFVDSRRERQRLLDRDPRLDYWVILDEAVLHREVGGRAVMQAQLEHLLQLARRQRITLQIVPFSAGAHAGMEGSFTLLRFPADSMADLIYVESRSGQFFLSRESELLVYRDVLDHLRATADSLSRSLDLVQAAAQRFAEPPPA